MAIARRIWLCSILLFAATAADAQVQTGSIVGTVTDSSNAVLPGTVVSVAGERLIGGVQTFTTDATGAYRFDRPAITCSSTSFRDSKRLNEPTSA